MAAGLGAARVSAGRGTMGPMPVVLVLAAVAILVGIVVVATGRGGELELPAPDSARYGRELVTASDLAAFRPPTAFLGYSAQATDQALRRVARVVAERDAELAMLRHEVAVLRARQPDDGNSGRPAAGRDQPAGGRHAGSPGALDPFVALEPDLPDSPPAAGDYGSPPRYPAAVEPADFGADEPAWGDAGWTDAETTDG
jgi:hypothetical protein